jgi:RNA polymerase sigma-70 factor (ECF subfamily)
MHGRVLSATKMRYKRVLDRLREKFSDSTQTYL